MCADRILYALVFWREFKDELTRGAEGDLNAFDKVNYAMDLTIWSWAFLTDPEFAELSPSDQDMYAMQIESYLKRVFFRVLILLAFQRDLKR